MTTKLSYTLIAGGILLGLSGCGGSGSGSSGGNFPTSMSIVTAPKNLTQAHHANTTQNTTLNHLTNQNLGNTQNITNIGKASSATAFAVNTNDNKALNITRVVRPTGELAKEVQEVVRLTNQLRAEKGLKPLQYDDKLSAFAQMRASELEITFLRHNQAPIRDTALMHERVDRRQFYEGSLIGIGSVGENVHGGTKSNMGSEAVKSWKNSPPHYSAMIDKKYERIGVGVIHIPNSKYKYYWVQIFGSGTASFPYEFVDAGKDNPEPLRQVVVDGRTIPLDLFSKGNWQSISGRNQGQFTGYDHTRFGAVTSNNQTQLFYQGNQTLDYAIPKSGTANYRGTALVIKDGKTNTNIDSQFTANFGTRKLNGTLSQRNNTLYTISADINGSSFASKVDAPVQTQGSFFGQNAEELAGVFKDTKTNTKGVYGAKK